MEYDNTNRGALWSNIDKAGPKHPDFKGTLNVAGKEYWLSGWINKGAANPAAPEITFKVEDKQQKRKAKQPTDYDPDESLPF